MLIESNISNIRKVLFSHKTEGRKIGFVPTMGALHQGHISLVKAAKEMCDIVVVSIYVNPTQFNNPEDLINYPRTFEKDVNKLEDYNVDIVFNPDDSVMYNENATMTIGFGAVEEVMEGCFRPGHFSGVGIVVTKLFNIIQPDYAFFGQKDFQQLTLIKKLVDEFMFPIEIIAVPIEREVSGLAMSSRNERLNPTERQEATIFYQALKAVKTEILNNASTSKESLLKSVNQRFEQSKAQLEYFEIISDKDLKAKSENLKSEDTVLCIAGYVGNVRLIDNMYIIS